MAILYSYILSSVDFVSVSFLLASELCKCIIAMLIMYRLSVRDYIFLRHVNFMLKNVHNFLL